MDRIKQYANLDTAGRCWGWGLAILVLVGAADYATRYDLKYAPFYFAPVFIVAWTGRPVYGCAMALVCALVCLLIDIGHPYATAFAFYWNASIRLVDYLMVVVMVLKIRWLFDDEKRSNAKLNATCEELRIAQERTLAETAARLAALEQLRHADRLKTIGHLASGVAHELGTPLSIILGRAEIIGTSLSKEEDVKENIGIIEKQAERMSSIIQQLLSFARAHSPHREPADLDTVVRQAAEFMEAIAKKQNVRLQVNSAGAAIRVQMDVPQVQQVIFNLILNAVQATPPRGAITIRTERWTGKSPDSPEGDAREYGRISIKDTGEGIPEDHLELLFEPFFTTKRVNEGTGLGLSIAHGIVTDHGGWITVNSQVGQGSDFVVYLPMETPL